MTIYKLSLRESNRINFMRSISLLLVIYLHQYEDKINFLGDVISLEKNKEIEIIEYVISRIISFSAVPTFFLISSVLLYSKEISWFENIKKKIKTLAIPYILWTTIYIGLYFLGQTLPITVKYFANAGRLVKEMNALDFLGAYLGYFGQGRFVNALWFLADLFLLNIFAILIKKIVDKCPLFVLILTIIIWFCGGTSFSFIVNSQSICFWVWGYYIVKYNLRMKNIDKVNLITLLLSYIVLIFAEYQCFYFNSTFISPVHGVTSIVGILFLVLISGYVYKPDDVNKVKIIDIISKYSFFIYASHDFVQTILKKVTSKLFFQTDIISFGEYMCIPLITCMICIFVAFIVNKFFPKIYLFLSGSRK